MSSAMDEVVVATVDETLVEANIIDTDMSGAIVVAAADETAPPVAVMEQEEEEAEEEEVDGEEGVVEDTDAGGAEGDDSMMDDENINIKMEVPDDIAGSTERCYSSLLTLSSVLDAEVLLQAVGHKIFDRYTIWDLMLEKVRSSSRNAEFGALPLLIDDCERILLELRSLVELCMDYLPAKPLVTGGKKVPLDKGEFLISDLVGTALCLESGIWKKKEDLQGADYKVPLTLDSLLPAKPPSARMPYGTGPHAKIRRGPGRPRKNPYAGPPLSSVSYNSGLVKRGPGRPRKIKTDADLKALVGDDDSDPEFKTGMPLEMKRGPGRPRGYRVKRGQYRPRRPKEEIEAEKANRRKRLRCIKTEDKKFICKFPDCKAAIAMIMFPNRAEFEQHFLDNHLTAEDRVLPCLVDGCEEKFALTSERNKHMDAVHEKTIPCNHCDKKFYGAKEAEAHVTRWHTDDGTPRHSQTLDDIDDPSCVCTRCGKKFTKSKAVDVHEKTCDGLFVRQPKFYKSKVGSVFYCQELDCPVKTAFESEYSLRMHFYDNHLREAEKIFVCEYCQMRFALRTMLNKHVKLAHEKKHICDYCGRKFGAKDKLRQHVYTHTGEKPYVCDKCDYRTAKKYNLDQHKQSKHQDFGVKSHYCELCGKGFVTQGRVRQHKKIIHREGRVSGQKLSRKAAAAAAAAGLTVVDVNGELKKVTAVAEGEHQVLVRQQLEHEEQGRTP